MSTVEKVFQIIEQVVSHQGKGLSFSGVVSRTNLPKASTHRILKSLVRMGYLRFDDEIGRYFGDLKLAFLGSAVTSHFDLKGYVRPHLLKLQAETKHTCNLGVLSGDAGVYLDKLESPEDFGIKLYSAIGKRFPLHCTGMGKILLAGMQPAERRKIFARGLKPFTPRTITDPVALERAGQSAAVWVRAGPGGDHAWDNVRGGPDPEWGRGYGRRHQRRLPRVHR